LAGDDTCFGEHFEVVAHRRLALAYRLDEIARADRAALRGGEQRHQPKSNRVGECGELPRQSFGGLFGQRLGGQWCAARFDGRLPQQW
jgi:hypothetical protein